MEQTVSMIKSCIVINKGGLPLKDLNSSYKELVGDSIPYKKYNHDSLESFLHSIPEIYICDSSKGQILTIKDPKLAHISDMVAKQKGIPKKKKPPGHSLAKNSVSYKIRPKVPASSLKVSNTGLHEVKCMIKSCIATTKGGLPLSALNRTYRELVGEPIHFKKYNYDSLEELVYNIPEVVQTDGRDGLILTIKDPKLAHITDLVAKQKGQATSKVRAKTAVSKSSVAYKGKPSPIKHRASAKQVQPDRNEVPSWVLQYEMDTISIVTRLLVINNGQLYLNDLIWNYKDFVGEFIPFQKFNYESLQDFLSSVPEFQISHDAYGQIVTLKDSKFSRSHQAGTKLKYEDNERKKEKYETISMIKACLKINSGGLLIEDLNFYYEDLVGEFIPYRRFNYQTLVEFLCDIPEIFISQRRSGYFLTLDQPDMLQRVRQDVGYAPRASLPTSSYGERLAYHRGLLRHSFGPESDIRDLMCKNGMIRVTIRNDHFTSPSGPTALQTSHYNMYRNSGWKSGDHSLYGNNY